MRYQKKKEEVDENNERDGVACSFSLIARVLIEQDWKNPVSEKIMINSFFFFLLFRTLFDATN